MALKYLLILSLASLLFVDVHAWHRDESESRAPRESLPGAPRASPPSDDIRGSGPLELKYKEFNFQLREFAFPDTQQMTGTNFEDLQFFDDFFQDFNTGVTLGWVQGTCTYTESLDTNTGAYKQECEFTFIFREGGKRRGNEIGSFTVTGLFADQPTDLAVAGGTGIFSAATGVARQSTLSDDGNGTVTYGYNVRLFAKKNPIVLEELWN